MWMHKQPTAKATLALKQRSDTSPCTSHPSMHNWPTGWVTPTLHTEQFQLKPLTPTRFSVSQLFGLMWSSSIGCLVTPIPNMSQRPPRYICYHIYWWHIFVTTYMCVRRDSNAPRSITQAIKQLIQLTQFNKTQVIIIIMWLWANIRLLLANIKLLWANIRSQCRLFAAIRREDDPPVSAS